jgi:dTMP kinase
VVFSTGFDYWESGMDLNPSEDMYESFRKYQTALLAEFEKLVEEYQFKVIDATQDIPVVFEDLREGISDVLTESEPPSLETVAAQGRQEAPSDGNSPPADNNGSGN